MTSKEILVEIMRIKKRIIVNYMGNELAELYFNFQDEQSIYSWENTEKIELVISKIKKCNVLYGDEMLYGDVCPFCWYYVEECDRCLYGKYHEMCFNKTSSWGIVFNIFKNSCDRHTMNNIFYNELNKLFKE